MPDLALGDSGPTTEHRTGRTENCAVRWLRRAGRQINCRGYCSRIERICRTTAALQVARHAATHSRALLLYSHRWYESRPSQLMDGPGTDPRPAPSKLRKPASGRCPVSKGWMLRGRDVRRAISSGCDSSDRSVRCWSGTGQLILATGATHCDAGAVFRWDGATMPSEQKAGRPEGRPAR